MNRIIRYILTVVCLLMSAGITAPAQLVAPSGAGFGTLPGADSMRDHYRRSSICLILLVHDDKPYATEMARVFQNFPMPQRYNEHNIDLRVVHVNGKQNRKDIERMLRNENVGREVVGRWFNRDSYTGMMDMSLVHDRGGYGAFHDDYLRTVGTVRGTATLRDEGIELLESTFVLVCDMEYAEQNKGFKIGAILTGIVAVGMAVSSGMEEYNAQQAWNQGNYYHAQQHLTNAQTMQDGALLTAAGAAALNDLSRFRVKIHSYLYKLNWNESYTDNFFNNYWVDSSVPRNERQRRIQMYNNLSCGLEYIGDYSEGSAKTKLVSCTDVDAVVLDVCETSVNKSVKKLAEKFAIFRPRTPFYWEGSTLYSHIGTKEDVTTNRKYEIVRRVRNKKGVIEYKRVGTVVAMTPWDNVGISFDRYFDPTIKGTAFNLVKGNHQELAMTPGLQIREMK